MTQRIISLLLLFGVSSCTTTSNSFFCGTEKWQYIVDDWQNVVTICRSGSQASMNVYYPNTTIGSPATNCFQTGSSTESDQELNFYFWEGRCENGRNATTVNFSCRVAKQEMHCTDVENKRKVVFLRQAD